jgi:DNA-binding XRE family transcriptional regulator
LNYNIRNSTTPLLPFQAGFYMLRAQNERSEHTMSENLLAGRIAQLRKEAGMTQEQLGNALGLTYQSVSKWENGVSHS